MVAHAGSVATRLLADRTGLTAELSKAMVRRNFAPLHDRGRVLVDVAVMLADGGEAITDIDVLRHQVGVLGAGVPASKVAGTNLDDVVVLDVDATIVIAHSEKENAAATFKRTFGYHPLGVWCGNTGEFLAAKLRAGNAGSNTAADHIQVLTEAETLRSRFNIPLHQPTRSRSADRSVVLHTITTVGSGDRHEPPIRVCDGAGGWLADSAATRSISIPSVFRRPRMQRQTTSSIWENHPQ